MRTYELIGIEKDDENIDNMLQFEEEYVYGGFGIGNYYGGLSMCIVNDKYFWSIEDYSGHYWEEIPESLFIELKKFLNLSDYKTYYTS
jgi:hypothetical protein